MLFQRNLRVYSLILCSHRKKLLNIVFIICNLKLTKDAEAPMVRNSPFLLQWSCLPFLKSSDSCPLFLHSQITRADSSGHIPYNLNLNRVNKQFNHLARTESEYSIIRCEPIHPSNKKKKRQFKSHNPHNSQQCCHHGEIKSYDLGSRRGKQHLGHLINSGCGS